MPPSCSVCVHVEAATIDAELAAGASLRTVSARFGVSVSAVNRHKAHAGENRSETRSGSHSEQREQGSTTASKASAAHPSGGRSRALGPGERGSQNPGARETLTEIRGQKGRSAQEDSLTRRARVKQAAALIEPSDKWARIRFLYGLKPMPEGDYEPGVTPAICAEVWGMTLARIEVDASIAGGIRQLTADPDFDQRVWYRATYDSLEQAIEHRKYIYDLLTKAGMPVFEDGPKAGEIDWKGITAHAEALAKCHDQIGKVTEQLGKASGAISSGPAVTINLENPTTPNDRRLRAALDARDGVLLGALSQALGELVADRVLRGRVLERVADLIEPGGRPGDSAMVVTATNGGGK